jgi:hypothetical protein
LRGEGLSSPEEPFVTAAAFVNAVVGVKTKASVRAGAGGRARGAAGSGQLIYCRPLARGDFQLIRNVHEALEHAPAGPANVSLPGIYSVAPYSTSITFTGPLLREATGMMVAT